MMVLKVLGRDNRDGQHLGIARLGKLVTFMLDSHMCNIEKMRAPC